MSTTPAYSINFEKVDTSALIYSTSARAHTHGADIQKRLESLKHLGGSYSMTGNGSYSCDVTVYNYTSMGNWTPHTWKTTVSWNTGDGNLESALIRKLGPASKWSITYTGADGQKYNSFMYLQANVQDDLENYKTRDDAIIHIYF
jgi:hypothetical protein